MIEQPKLLSNQFAVLMADGATGHVLTMQGNVYFNDASEVYKIFDDCDTARVFIKSKQSDNDTLEFTIYNSSLNF